MDLAKGENRKYQTPTTKARRFVDRVINSNSNCDSSPFRLLPNYSTPPSRFVKIKNPFDSPLMERLHLPICSPGLFAKPTSTKEDKFSWTICDLSHIKPVEIETNSIVEQHTSNTDPSTESQLQEKISSFFSEHSVVPSPINQEASCKSPGILNKNNFSNVCTQTKLSLGFVLPKQLEQMLKSYENFEEVSQHNIDNRDSEDGGDQYLPEDVYYDKLFQFKPESLQSSPPMSTGDSPLQFSPWKVEATDENFSENTDKNRRMLNESRDLSPITPEGDNLQKDASNYMSIRESKSACRLIFTENMSLDCSDNVVPDVLDPISAHGNSFEDTMRLLSPLKENGSFTNWDMEYKHVSLVSECEENKMDVSLPHTPNTGLFIGQRKRLSESFKDLQDFLGNTEGVQLLSEGQKTSESASSSGGLSDLGYDTGSGITGPSLVENTWNNSHLIASTPTKKRTD